MTLDEIILDARRIVFFGGAGVSTESGIPDFRSAEGLYAGKSKTKYDPAEIVSHSFFIQHPQEFFDYYRNNLIYPTAKPNPAHFALASLEQAGKLNAVITQNIDGLHQLAGSRNVYELHGSVHRNYCVDCGKPYGLEAITATTGVPVCDSCGGIVRPDVVLYEEPLDTAVTQAAVEAISTADILIVGGTSLVVYPAAGMVHHFSGEHIVVINKQATGIDFRASLTIREPIGETLQPFVNYQARGDE
ncbi:MAG: NAD-dependent protein deacylase [Propionibacteriaceae bacterium]|nr:NAD-dependent protein deacylase [Propionibacteriaceae bacterium]